MGERDSYAPGTFCWVDLGTTDAAAAKAFYVSLFGWETADTPMGEGRVYTMASLGGRHVAALYDRGPGDTPPAWMSYVSVDDVDGVAARAGEAGALEVGAPIDVFDAGRMALIQDPTGAHLAAWQPGGHPGAGIVNSPDVWCLNQLNTTDPARARAFYEAVFGWTLPRVGPDEQPYWGIFNRGALNGGMMPLAPGAGTSHWLAYFGTGDVDAAAGRIEELGGSIVVPPMPVPPSGRIAVARDPQGATFALFAGRFDD